MIEEEYLAHYGIEKQTWGVRRYQYANGQLTPEGYERYYGDKKNKKEKLSVEEQIKKASRVKARILAHPRPADVFKHQDLFTNDELKKLNERFLYINTIKKNIPPKKKSLINRIVSKFGDTLIANLSSSLQTSSKILFDKMISETMNVPLKDVQSYDKSKGDKNKGDKSKDNKSKDNKNKNEDSDSDK